MINFQSLSHRLHLALASALILFTLLLFSMSALVLKEKSDQLHDNMLLAVSKNIEDKLYVKNGELKIEMDYFAIDTLSNARSEKIFYRIVAPDGKRLAGYEGLPDVPTSDTHPLFYDTYYAGTELKAIQYTAKTKLGNTQIIVAESTQGRRAALIDVIAQISVIASFICIIAIGFIALIIRKGLHPLTRLQKEIRLRSETHLTPITCNVPPEVDDLVHSLNQLMKRLHNSIEASHNFNSDLSHQLRTPLTEMKMQLMMYRNSNDTQQLEHIEQNIDMMGRMTQQMLHYAKTQNNYRTEHHWSTVDLIHYCKQFCLKHASMVYEQGQALAFETNIDVVYCHIDEVMLESALLNLIENSLKYGRPHHAEGEILLKIIATSQTITLSIMDKGNGVNEEHFHKLLKRRIRIDQTQHGFGLGLAIVKQIAEIHGAQLEFSNVKPTGFNAAITHLARVI